MLGIIFTNLVEMIETTISYEMADEILEEANLSSDGIFTSVGHYPLEDVV
ncbi:MAG: heme NO-binding domain-containing protein, partial [Glaciecola sp.]